MANAYSKMSEIEHILKRPDMYMGENTLKKKNMILYNPDTNIVYTDEVEYSTGLLKIFDEILMNAVDNIQRNVNLENLSVYITDDTIIIKNDGKSIPIELFEGTDTYIPEVIFTQPRTGSNFDDNKKRTVGGKNGIGCKLTTIFSSSFEIDIINNKQRYIQTITENDTKISPPKITKTQEKDSVTITFTPDFKRFNVEEITEDMRRVMFKRLHDMSYLPISIKLNDKQVPYKQWEEFTESYKFSPKLYHYRYTDPDNKSLMWKVSFGLSDKFRQISFVNYISTYSGGEHVNHILDQITTQVMKEIGNKYPITTSNVKSKICLFVSAIIVNPDFNSQAKEKLSTRASNFGSECKIPPKLIKQFISESSIISLLTESYTKKENTKLKKTNITSIQKLVEANYAGTRHGKDCTLFLCEGLSAKTMVDSGICILGHDYYGCYPLRGKLLNSRNASDLKYLDNRELKDLKVILGLQDGKVYTNASELRYGKVVCVKDADSDGADIMGLIINFFDTKFPSLLKIPGFFSEFISPMIQVLFRNGTKVPFYNEVEYRKYMLTSEAMKSIGVKFIKGLATNEDSDIKNYFKNYKDNCINILFEGEYQEHLDKAFNKDRANDRKVWLTTITPDTHLPRLKGTPIPVIDFINNDLVLYSMDSCIRSIPSCIDGLKPSQRKILYTLFSLPVSQSRKQMKVFQLGGLVAKTSNYHHGDQSMNETIIKMAQDYPGSNNIPLLERSGQFGSRMENGNDAGQPRYISCCLSEITRYIFPECDDGLLNYKIEDNTSVEPIYYIPIIPFVLVNGCLGLGTGWSTNIPAFSPRDIIKYVKALLKGKKLNPINSWYRGFNGIIEKTERGWNYTGTLEMNGHNCLVTEIPLDISISDFQHLINSLMTEREVTRKNKGKETVTKLPAIIRNVENENKKDANSVRFNIEFIGNYTEEEVIDILKLRSTKTNTNMVLFDDTEKIAHYATIYNIIYDWYTVRKGLYEKRIKALIEKYKKEAVVIGNKARFIKENVEETINIRNVPRDDVDMMLDERKYDRIDEKFDYLLDMKISYLTKEKYEKLLKELEDVRQKIHYYEHTDVETEWLKDIDLLENYMNDNDICL